MSELSQPSQRNPTVGLSLLDIKAPYCPLRVEPAPASLSLAGFY